MVGSSQWVRTVGVCVRAGVEGRTVCIILSDMPEGVAGVTHTAHVSPLWLYRFYKSIAFPLESRAHAQFM